MTNIRRKEFSIADEEDIKEFLESMSFGYLTTHTDLPYPQTTPLNFVYFKHGIYFHGSLKGSKMTHVEKFPNVSFAVADEYAIIPSWFTDSVNACPATAFFKSVIVYGKAEVLQDLDEKALALQALMDKLQPEGKFQKIEAQSEIYQNELKAVGVVRIKIDYINAKFKFGQNLSPEKFQAVTRALEKRNAKRDLETVREMKKRYKKSSN